MGKGRFFAFVITIVMAFSAYSQPGDPGEEDPDEVVPLKRTEILLIAGGFLGIWKILSTHKVYKNPCG